MQTLGYEWIVETLDQYGDIFDVSHWDTAVDALHHAARIELAEGEEIHIGICRDSYYPNESRSWAYVGSDGTFPSHFEDAGGARIAKVPTRYVRELAAARHAKVAA